MSLPHGKLPIDAVMLLVKLEVLLGEAPKCIACPSFVNTGLRQEFSQPAIWIARHLTSLVPQFILRLLSKLTELAQLRSCARNAATRADGAAALELRPHGNSNVKLFFALNYCRRLHLLRYFRSIY